MNHAADYRRNHVEIFTLAPMEQDEVGGVTGLQPPWRQSEDLAGAGTGHVDGFFKPNAGMGNDIANARVGKDP